MLKARSLERRSQQVNVAAFRKFGKDIGGEWLKRVSHFMRADRYVALSVDASYGVDLRASARYAGPKEAKPHRSAVEHLDVVLSAMWKDAPLRRALVAS